MVCLRQSLPLTEFQQAKTDILNYEETCHLTDMFNSENHLGLSKQNDFCQDKDSGLEDHWLPNIMISSKELSLRGTEGMEGCHLLVKLSIVVVFF